MGWGQGALFLVLWPSGLAGALGGAGWGGNWTPGGGVIAQHRFSFVYLPSL